MMILFLLPLSLVTPGANAEEKVEPLSLGVEDFPLLDDFESAEAYQAHIDQYVKDCRDAWITSSMGSRCGIGADLWDRELNVAYKILLRALNAYDVERLKRSQRSWIVYRDETLAFSKRVLALHYDDGQRMWDPVMSLDYSQILADLIKARTLQLRRWHKQVANPVSGLM
jgi:uncharacterized protein YecT (DUF1311 family)